MGQKNWNYDLCPIIHVTFSALILYATVTTIMGQKI